MSRQSEANRRKDTCIECGRFMPIKAKNMCQNCWHKHKRRYDLNFFLRTRYVELKNRCSNPNEPKNNYLGMKYCSLMEFYSFFINDNKLKKLFKNWQKSNFDFKLAPSIDRIDPKKGYILGNMQFITHSENCTKDQIMTKIRMFSKDRIYIRDFISQGEAERQLGIPQANIWKVLNKERNSAGGYYFEYA